MNEMERATPSWDAAYFDGKSARRHVVTVERTRTGLLIRGESVGEMQWPYVEMRRDERVAPDEPIRYERGALDAPEVLVVADPSFLPAMRGTKAAGGALASLRRRSIGALLLPAIVALAAIVAFWVYALPVLAARVAASVPVELEDRLGRSAVNLVTEGATTCTDAPRRAAIDKMLATLVADGRGGRYSYRVTIIDDSLVNAFAAPGGHIVLFQGLVAQAGSAEEVAGVLAHEIQHVTQQHGLQSILREMPGRLLLSSLFGSNPLGGSVASAAYTLGSLSYARADELAADLGAVRMLTDAQVDPNGMIQFFRRSTQASSRDSRLMNYISTHPSNAARIEALDAEAQAEAANASPTPILSATEWAALRAACTK